MAYTVKDISTKTGITAHTLRFYEKPGVLPYAERTKQGIRMYDESSMEWIETFLALRSTGIPLVSEELRGTERSGLYRPLLLIGEKTRFDWVLFD